MTKCVCGAKIRGDRSLCANCVEITANCLLTLYRREVDHRGRPAPNLLDELVTTVTRQGRLSDPVGVRGGAETPMVFHVLAAAHLRALAAFLRVSARHYRLDAHTDALALEVRRVDNAYAHAAWLHCILDDIVKSDDAGEFSVALTRLVDAATAVIDRPPDMWFAGPCPTCQADMYATEGAATVKCPECHNTADVAAQRERLLAAIDDVLATAAEISRAVHITGVDVTPSKITNLYHRGKLVRHGRNRTGDHLYRMGDVLTVIHAQRRP